MSQLYRNAICLPCTGAENGPLLAEGAFGGVFNQEKLPIKDAFLVRRYRQQTKLKGGRWDPTTGHDIVEAMMILPGEVGETKARLEGRYIFAGYLFPHYGHFLLESLSRLWFIRQYPDLPLIWLGVHNQPDFTPMHQEFFDLFGLKNPMHILTEQTEIEELVIPEAGYVMNNHFSDAQVQALTAVGPTPLTPGKKVWLSRSNLSTAIVLNARHVENILEAAGWQIFHPEDHSIADQLAMLADAEVIAGSEGSAFHTLMMMPHYRGRVLIFGRGLKLNVDYVTIGHKLNHDLMFVSPPRIRWDYGKVAWQSDWLWPEVDFILNTLEVERPNRPWHPQPEPLQTIAKSLADFFKRRVMIELWPETNSVAAALQLPNTAIVSENMMFDVAPLKAAGTKYYEFTADQFFTILAPKSRCDLYCFRHQADPGKLIRAFNSSLVHSGKDTLWLIEGYGPGAPDSANECLLAAIRDAYPAMRVARVKGDTTAVVWHEGRTGFAPRAEPEDTAAADFVADIPAMTMNEIAQAITEAQEPSQPNQA